VVETDSSLVHHLSRELLAQLTQVAVVVVDAIQQAMQVDLALSLSSTQTAAHLQSVQGLQAQHHLLVALR
jgi:hypothetical protein